MAGRSATLPRSLLVLVVMAACASPAAAQSTRAEIARAARKAKVTSLASYQPGRVEAALFYVEDRRLMERIFNPPRGLFVRFGGLPQGAGLAAGPAWRHSNHVISLTGSSAASFRGYWEADATFAVRPLADDRAQISVGARRRHLPQEDFFGLGSASATDIQTSFTLDETRLAADAAVKPADWLLVSAGVAFERPRVGRGTDARVPSIQDEFTDASAPGLDAQPDFLRAGVSATVDHTDRTLGPAAGGLYRLAFDRLDDRDLGRYSFSQWTVDLRQHIPLVAGARTIVLRASATGVRPDDGHDVPFYYQPTLGGPYSLRILPAYRYRDRHALLVQVEYRYELNAFMTGAVFYDAGRVAFRAADLWTSGFTHDAGIGLRMGFMSNVALRAEVAFGESGARLVFKFSDVF
jgi:hypothetical protein